MTHEERTETLTLVDSFIQRCRWVQPKFAPGSAQYTLLRNRIQALEIAQSLLENQSAVRYSDGELSSSIEPLSSVIRKCEKARSKYEPGAGQYRPFTQIIRAMDLSRLLITEELQRRNNQ